MLSPIARQSLIASRDHPVKGTGRKITNHFKRPSILHQIETCPTIDLLGALKDAITRGVAFDRLGSREFTPDARTLAKWAQAQWQRAHYFLLTATTAEELCYCFNVMLRWPKHESTERSLQLAFDYRARQLPSPSELLAINGIELEGITCPRTKCGPFESDILNAAYTKL